MILPTSAATGNLGRLGSRELCLTLDGDQQVADTGLLAVRAWEKPLRIIADLATQLPDPRSPRTSPTPSRPFSPRRSIRSWPATPPATTPTTCATIRERTVTAEIERAKTQRLKILNR